MLFGSYNSRKSSARHPRVNTLRSVIAARTIRSTKNQMSLPQDFSCFALSFFCFAHRRRCAAAIALRPAIDILWPFLPPFPAGFLLPFRGFLRPFPTGVAAVPPNAAIKR